MDQAVVRLQNIAAAAIQNTVLVIDGAVRAGARKPGCSTLLRSTVGVESDVSASRSVQDTLGRCEE